MDHKELVDLYLQQKRLSWAASTIKASRSRLYALPFDLLEKPEALYLHLKEVRALKPYSIKTNMIQSGEFLEWLMDEGHKPRIKNPIKVFFKTHALLFKHVYEKERLDITYDDALARILKIQDEAVRTRALQLLAGGLRFTESTTLKNEMVLGKGGKKRRVFLPEELQEATEIEYASFWRALKKETGLKPHTLRKLAVNRWIKEGAQLPDVMSMAGWASVQTAASYMQAAAEEDLKQFAVKAFKKAL